MSVKVEPKIERSWKEHLLDEFQKPYFGELKQFLIQEKQVNTVYPMGSHIFNAFEFTPFDDVKVVILGQDPYHGPNQAHGLSFSVLKPTPPPPSLLNIYKELRDDLGVQPPNHGDLTKWAKQGVLLLNTVLTVRAHQAGSHRKRGWENFTDEVIKLIASQKQHTVFVLWGRDAQSKQKLITGEHLIIKSTHPSPLAAHRGFLGSRPFSKINTYLESMGKTPIDWSLD
jgi:uracil-DNA glycosylase